MRRIEGAKYIGGLLLGGKILPIIPVVSGITEKNTIFTHKDQSTLGRLQARVSSWIHLHPGLDDHLVTSWEHWECQAA